MVKKALAGLVLAVLSGCASPQRLKPYATDGCSWFPEGTPRQKTAWHHCCEEHDRKYWSGGPKAERLKADRELRVCVEAAGHPEVADAMLAGTRVAGTPYLPTGFRWGYGWNYPRGYGPLTDAEKKEVAKLAPAPSVDVSTSAVETVIKPSSTTADNVGPTSPNRVLPGEPPKRKNYLIPALEIPLFEFTLNSFDRVAYGQADYGSGLKSSWRNATKGPWVVDQDEFAINQVGHPYQGAMYYGFARASGLNFWEGLAYSNAGSLLWEVSGETTNPSINDQVASGNAGALLGEPLFRMANLLLEGGGPRPGFWRELGAAFVSPPTGLNRLLFGERYTPVLKSRDAAVFTQVHAGPVVTSKLRNPGSADTVQVSRRAVAADFSMDYGLPGKDGYLYLRPFDYFNFELGGRREGDSTFGDMTTRGLLFGDKYEAGDGYQGIWGLYGSFDFYSPQIFRFSTTAASLGSTFQWRLPRKVALQGTAMTGLGYGTAGTITPQNDEKDFHYGATPQGLLALRLIFGGRAMLDATARGYYLTGAGSSRANGSEKIGRLDSSFFVRLFGRHAVGLTYLLTTREANYSSGLAARHQLVETVGVAYNLLGNARFGAVDPD